MKVLLINGSPHAKGSTFTALNEVAMTLEKEGIETELIHIGNQAIRGCIACGKCHECEVVGQYYSKSECDSKQNDRSKNT